MAKGKGLMECVTPSDLDDPEVQGWMQGRKWQGLMSHPTHRSPAPKKDRGLRVPKNGTPLYGEALPEVLKGVV
ncbi:hypothetical protein [Timonella senegalensis]|uniref:hypothetical protein n=1 Tax=Timonella senegalensis TaxID=1465825 RepID=UPI0028A6F402|nr:hypothetical protein [Timonella senegalensis]